MAGEEVDSFTERGLAARPLVAAIVVEPEVELRESVWFNDRQLWRAEEVIRDHLELIKQKWAYHIG